MKLMLEQQGEYEGLAENAGSKKARRIKRPMLIILVVLVLLAVLAIISYGYSQLYKKPSIDIGTKGEVAGKVLSLSSEQQEQVAAVRTLIPAQDMDWTYAKAIALAALDRQEESLKVYRTLDGTGKAPYYIYIEYALAARQAQDNALAASMMTKALEKLEADSSVSDGDKAVLKRRLTSKLDAFNEDIKG